MKIKNGILYRSQRIIVPGSMTAKVLRRCMIISMGDGKAERSVETFKQVMRCMLEERHINETDWVTLVQEVTFSCISYTNASTSNSPHEVMYGVHLRSRVDAIFPYNRSIDFPDLQTYYRHAEEARKEVNAKVNDNMLNSQQSMEIIFIRRARSC